MEKKRELKEITLKAKLMKLEPKIELAKQYDEYVNNKPQIQEPEPEQEQIVYIPKPTKQKLDSSQIAEAQSMTWAKSAQKHVEAYLGLLK